MRHYALKRQGDNEQIAELRKLLMLHIETTDSKFSENNETIRQIVNALNNLLVQPRETRKIGFNIDG